jgi:hypothetical protein
MTKPSDTTSPRAPWTMSRTVGAMISFTTLDEMKLLAVRISWFSIVGSTSGPNNGAT